MPTDLVPAERVLARASSEDRYVTRPGPEPMNAPRKGAWPPVGTRSRISVGLRAADDPWLCQVLKATPLALVRCTNASRSHAHTVFAATPAAARARYAEPALTSSRV